MYQTDSTFILLEDDEWRDFNFSAIFDPSLKRGPLENYIYELAIKGRKADIGARSAQFEFADAMHWTLRRATFDCFQQTHGPRPFEYRDWFYSKLYQFLSILLYEKLTVWGLGQEPQTDLPWEEGVLSSEGPMLEPEELEQAFALEDNERIRWTSLVQWVAERPENRLAALRQWLASHRSAGAGGRKSPKRARRDRLIREALLERKSRREACALLDQNGLATTAKMQQAGLFHWTEAWDDPEFNKNVQSIFSKALAG